MKRALIAGILVVAGLGLVLELRGQAPSGPWQAVEEIIGQKGSVQGGEVFRIGLPRADLEVKRGEVAIHPVLGLGS